MKPHQKLPAREALLGHAPTLLGTEIDPQALNEARAAGLSENDLRQVELRDFLLDPPPGPFKAIVANPPYIRHHRLPATLKARLRALCVRPLGQPLDGGAGLHISFLLRALQLLDPREGRLAFIMPADTCEGVFAPLLWGWIAQHYRLDAVVTFDAEASPFPGVETNALVLLICRATSLEKFFWARCTEAGTAELKRWTLSAFRHRGIVQPPRDDAFLGPLPPPPNSLSLRPRSGSAPLVPRTGALRKRLRARVFTGTRSGIFPIASPSASG